MERGKNEAGKNFLTGPCFIICMAMMQRGFEAHASGLFLYTLLPYLVLTDACFVKAYLVDKYARYATQPCSRNAF
jgi:hypothetical protein